jgi:hypothetical protein
METSLRSVATAAVEQRLVGRITRRQGVGTRPLTLIGIGVRSIAESPLTLRPAHPSHRDARAGRAMEANARAEGITGVELVSVEATAESRITLARGARTATRVAAPAAVLRIGLGARTSASGSTASAASRVAARSARAHARIETRPPGVASLSAGHPAGASASLRGAGNADTPGAAGCAATAGTTHWRDAAGASPNAARPCRRDSTCARTCGTRRSAGPRNCNAMALLAGETNIARAARQTVAAECSSGRRLSAAGAIGATRRRERGQQSEEGKKCKPISHGASPDSGASHAGLARATFGVRARSAHESLKPEVNP